MDDFQLNISSAPLPKPPKKKVFVPREDPSAAAQAPQKHASRSARREQGNANGDRPTQYVPQAKAAAGAAAGAAPAPRKRDPTKGFVSSLFSGAGHEQVSVGLPVEDSLSSLTPAPAPAAADLASRPAGAFQDLGIMAPLAAQLERMKMLQPTGIQRTAIPAMLDQAKAAGDYVIKAQTGSGKTLAFLLPIIERLIRWERRQPADAKIDRTLGTMAVIVVPTRELALQIHKVLETLLRYTSASNKDSSREASETPLRHWMVPCCLIGGEKKKAEKARIRKGATFVVSTPGRLVDHLKTTEAFQLRNLSYFVMDEADRLQDMGFEKVVEEIHQLLHSRQTEERQAIAEKTGSAFKPMISNRIKKVLCSATMSPAAQALARMTLKNPDWIVPDGQDASAVKARMDEAAAAQKVQVVDASAATNPDEASELERQRMRNVAATQDAESVSDTPTLLRQYVTFVPTKQRFVALVSLLYGLAVQAYNKSRMGAIGDHSALRSIKVIIFVATCDAVDFYHQVLSEAVERFRPQVAGPDGLLSADASEIELVRPTVYKLHGSMAQPDRHAQLNAFSAGAVNRPQVLLATDIVGRGIDIPNMTHIIQFDPPNEVGDYVHRIGRTARQNREGEAWLFLSPHEHEYVNVLTNRGLRLVEKKATAVLNHFCMTPKQARVAGYRPPSRVVEAVMNKLQFDFEKYVNGGAHGRTAANVMGVDDAADGDVNANRASRNRWQQDSSKDHGSGGYDEESGLSPAQMITTLAEKAFASHLRAYASHRPSERGIFNLKKLHMGHLAKTFGLQTAPTHIAQKQVQAATRSAAAVAAEEKKRKPDPNDPNEIKKRMYLMAKKIEMA